MLKNIKTTTKLAFMLAIPMLGLIYLATTITLDKLNVVRQMNTLQTFSEITVKSSALIHELQKERGISAGLTSSNSNKLFSNLQKQRLKTDNAIQKLSVIDFDNINVSNKLRLLISEENINKKRHTIDNSYISFQQQIIYYSDL
ncbi:nitrate- and nitrite sensing domain-containing protein, partial [Candidatus Halobeggiatoa sp. HSG11]|nr:nitrate- and nitrite sensing domain-containing protein [Candidatus Halobeggiatoa sp. HSG11]